MNGEVLQDSAAHSNYRRKAVRMVPQIARGILAAGIAYGAITPVADAASPTLNQNLSPQGISRHIERAPSAQLLDYAPTNHQDATENKPQDSPFDVLSHNEETILAGIGLAYALLAAIQTNQLSKKYEDKIERRVHMGATAALTGSTAILFADTLPGISINPEVPAGVFLGYTVMLAGFNIMRTYEHEHDPRKRASAIASSLALIGVGVGVCYASYKIS